MKQAIVTEEVAGNNKVLYNIVFEEDGKVVHTMSTTLKERAHDMKQSWESGTFRLLAEGEREPGVQRLL